VIIFYEEFVQLMEKVVLLILSYFSGSIPFGLIVAKVIRNIDIRQHGSGNIGATNVLRVLGKPWGILVFWLDFLKGFLPPLIGYYTLNDPLTPIIVIAAVCAVCGHNWPVWLHFKGGKGVTTSLGALMALGVVIKYVWIVLVISLFIWVIIFFLSRYVSLASLGASVTFFICSLFFPLPLSIKILSFLLFILILVRHKSNIKRLFSKTESRF